MALITNTFNGVQNFLGGIFSRALNATKRPVWRTYFNDRRAPVMVDMDNLIDVYQACPPLQIVINKKAEMLSNGIYKVRKITDKTDVENHWSVALIKNPNPLQPQREFIYEYSIYNDIYSNNFAYRNAPFTGSQPKVLWNLPSGIMKVVPTGKWLDQTDLKGIVDHYELLGDGAPRRFTTDDVMHINSGISKNILVSDSKMLALQMPISNIIGSLKTRNLFIYYGPKQIVSSKSKADEGAVPLGKKEGPRIEQSFNKQDYGINDHQSHTIVTNASLEVNKMSYPTKDMMLFEEMEEDFAWICGAYGIDRDIFPSIKGATFENKKQGEQTTYQSTIQTAANTFCNFIDQLLNLEKEGVECYLDYSHLAVMQEDEGKKATALKTKIEGIVAMVTGNILNPAQAQELIQRTLGIDIDETLASNNTTVNRLREFSPLVANNLLTALTTNQVLDLLGLPGIGTEGDKPRTPSANGANQAN